MGLILTDEQLEKIKSLFDKCYFTEYIGCLSRQSDGEEIIYICGKYFWTPDLIHEIVKVTDTKLCTLKYQADKMKWIGKFKVKENTKKV